MDPSVFFGRTRATRQTLKSKQQTTIKESENCKVNEDASKEIRKLPVKGQKAKPMTAGKENDAVKEATTTRASKRTQQALNKNAKKDELIGVKDKHKPASKSLKVHFDGDSQESPSSGGRRQSAAPCGPVYQNVRRSDVTGDPYNEYDFPLGSDSSPERTKKKKKKPIAGRTKPVKKAGGVVKWDPSKRPIIVKPKTVKKTALLEKDLTAFNATQAAKPKLNIKENPVKATLPVEANPVKATPPMKAAPPARATLPVKTTTPVEANPGKTIPPVRANPELHSTLTPDVNGARHFTSTPVLRQPSSKKVPNTAAPSSTGSTQSLTAIPSAKGQALSVPSFGLSCTGDESFEPSSPLVMADIPCAATPTSDVPNHISLNAQASLKSQSARFASRSSYFLSLPVRESPSFGNVLESPRRSSDGLLGTERAGNLDAVTSTPVTRSRRTNCEAVKSSNTENPDKPSVSQSKVTEKVLLPSGNDSDGNLSGIFDDIPRTSVLPTRMFSTHRGTIYIPEGQNVPKRNMPEFSPSKEQTSSRATVVKFSDPASSGLEQCFGFDNEDVTFVPQPTNIVKKPPIKKPNISIPDALAILRGQSKLASPANKTPRSIQTKLTDFVCSTPTSSPARVVAVSNEPVLTPTPVPLFDEDQIDAELQSPFSQPSRRSYDRFRPVKRIACGDEVHSGDEEEQIDSESTIPVKKKSKSYKRTKKPKETQLDAWASQLASHFDEVEQVELQLE